MRTLDTPKPQLLRLEWSNRKWMATVGTRNGAVTVPLKVPGLRTDYDDRVWHEAIAVATRLRDENVVQRRGLGASKYEKRGELGEAVVAMCAGWPRWHVAYILQNDAFADLVKVGSATDLHTRMRAYHLHCPRGWRLLAVCPGGLEMERDLHRRFSFGHVQGEWFECTSKVSQVVELLRAQHFMAGKAP